MNYFSLSRMHFCVYLLVNLTISVTQTILFTPVTSVQLHSTYTIIQLRAIYKVYLLWRHSDLRYEFLEWNQRPLSSHELKNSKNILNSLWHLTLQTISVYNIFSSCLFFLLMYTTYVSTQLMVHVYHTHTVLLVHVYILVIIKNLYWVI